MATLREMGLAPRTTDAPSPTLRDTGLAPRVPQEVTAFSDEASANSMGQLRRGFASGRISGDANAMGADMSSLRAAGRNAEADELSRRIAATQERAGVFAPAEQDVTALDWQPGRIADYALGAMGQGAASMLEPAGVAVGLGAASRAVGAIPTGPTRMLGGALRLTAPLAAGYLNYRQNKGEFVNDAYGDPTILAGKTPQEIENAAMFHGAAAGVLDTALPAMVGERVAGRVGMKALRGAGFTPRVGLDLAGEGTTEVLQGEVKRGSLGHLDPTRDTGGDSADRWNDLAGGVLGAAPFSAASHLAGKGHARLGVKDEPGDDVSGKAGKPTAPAAPPKDETLAQSFARGAAARRDPTDAEEDWRMTLKGEGDFGGDLGQMVSAQHAGLTKELGARAAKGDATAKLHLDALNAEDQTSPTWVMDDTARTAAHKHLLGDGTGPESDDRLIAAYAGRKLNQQVPHGDLGGGKVTGGGDDVGGGKVGPPVTDVTRAARAEHDQRVKLTTSILRDAVPKNRPKAVQLRGVAAELASELVEFGAKGLAKPSRGDVARVGRLGRQVVALYGAQRAEAVLDSAAKAAGIQGSALYKGLRGHVILAADQGSYQDKDKLDRSTAADQLVAVVPPRAQNILRSAGMDLTTPEGKAELLDRVEGFFDSGNDTALGGPVPTKFAQLFGKAGVEAMREVMGQRILGRVKQDFDEAESEALSAAEDGNDDTSPGESDDKTAPAEEGAAWERKGAEASTDRAPGARQRLFKNRAYSTDANSGGITSRNPFVRLGAGGLPALSTYDAVNHDGENTLGDLEARAYKLLGAEKTPAAKTQRRSAMRGEKKHQHVRHTAGRDAGFVEGGDVAEARGDHGASTDKHARHEIRIVSAKSEMDYAGLVSDKRIDTMADYLDEQGITVHKQGDVGDNKRRAAPTGPIYAIKALDGKIEALTASTPKIKLTAGKLTGNPEYAALEKLKDERHALTSALAENADIKTSRETGTNLETGEVYRVREAYAPTRETTAAELADAYFADRHLVVADEVGGKDHLRIVLGEFREMVEKGQKLLAISAKAGGKKGSPERAAAEFGMNLIRFHTDYVKASKDENGDTVKGDVAVPAHLVVAWVNKNKIEYDKVEAREGQDKAEVQALNFRNALLGGIAAMLADGFMVGTPYMKNEKGNNQSFAQGLPAGLHLGTLTQADMNKRAKTAEAAAAAAEASRAKRRAKLSADERAQEDAHAAERHDEVVANDQNKKDEEPARNTDADELVDEGKRAKPVDQVLSDEGEDLVGPRDPLAVTTIKDKAQFWDAPVAESADELAQRTMGNTGEGKRGRVPLSPVAPETVDTRLDKIRTPLDAESDPSTGIVRDQRGGVPTDFTESRNQNSTRNAAMDKPIVLTAANAMSKGTMLAKEIWGQLTLDRQAGFARVQALVRDTATQPQYAVPLAMLLTPDRVAGLVHTAKPEMQAKLRGVLEAMQSKVADALLDAGQSQAALTQLARSLTGDAELPSPKVRAALTVLAQPARDAEKAKANKADREAAEMAAKIAKKRAGATEAIVPKTEPAAIPAPSAPVAETRKLNQQTVQPTFSTDAQVAEAKAYIAKVLGPAVTVETGKLMGAMGEWIEANNLIKLSLSAGPMLLSVAHHEALHGLFSRLVKNSPEAAQALAGAMSSPRILARLNDLLAAHPEALKAIQGDTDLAREERVAYAYQFWAAGELDVDKPATTVFAKLRRLMREVFGMVRDSETALDIMTAFHDGKLAEPSAAGKVIADIMARQTWNDDVKRRFDKQIQHLHSAVAVSNDVLLKSESASVRALATTFFTNPGRAGDGQASEGYLNARTRVVRQYTNFLYKIVKGLNEKQMEQAVVHMQEKTPLADIVSPSLRDAVKGLRALTKRYYNYATEGQDTGGPGLKLEFLGEDHYPRVWDLAQLVSKRAEFIAMVMQPKYAKMMASAVAIANANVTTQRTTEDVAALMHEHLVEKNGVDDKGVESSQDVILSPFFASQKERSFKWLDDADVQPFLDKDLVGTMSRYLHQGIRAAEYARRFGNGGARLRELTQMIGDDQPGGGKVSEHGLFAKELYAAAKKAGVGESDAWVARRMDDIRKSVQAHEGSLGSDISPTWRKFSSAAMAYQNLRLLPLSLFAAFADPLSIAARGPGLSAAYDAFMTGLGDVWARWKDAASDMPAERKRSEWDEMAEAVGAVDSHMFLEQIGKAHTSEFMTDFARKSNRWLFMANGLTAWDRSMRVSATKYAALFLQSHKSLPDSKHSARWLKELGLTPADITLDADGKLVYDRHTIAATKGIALEQATAEADKIHYAITRWVEGAVLTPTAAQRPTWASDPRYAVLFHLKQFTYSFQDTVLKRAANEAREGNMNPIGALAAAVPTMIVSDIFKGFVQGGGSLPAYMKGWSLGDHVLHGVSRAGLGGTSELAIDGLRDPFSLLGPTVDQAATVLGNPSELGANMVNAIPGVRMFKGALDVGRTA